MRNRKRKEKQLSNLHRFIIETAHLTTKDTIMLLRSMMNYYSGHHAVALGVHKDTGELATYTIDTVDASEDAQLQAQVDVDVDEGISPVGFAIYMAEGSHLFLFPWTERACALNPEHDRKTVGLGLVKAFKYANECEGHPVPLNPPNGMVN